MLLMYHATFYGHLTFRSGDPTSWSLAGFMLAVVQKFWVGVPVFFVVSGYCISASVDSLRRRPHSLWDYFVRRFRRIYPPLWTMCIITTALAISLQLVPAVALHCRQLPNVVELSAWSWLGNFTAVESWRHNLIGDAPRYLIGNTWTLCYEEQFYVVTGILLVFAAKRFFYMAAIVTGIVVAARHVCQALGFQSDGFFWDGHWILFSVGILVYHAINYQSQTQRRWTTFTLCIGVLYGLAGVVLTANAIQRHLSEYVCVSALFGLGLLWLRRWDASIAGNWAFKPLAWSGRRSYSIYLTHYPLVVLVSSTAAMAGLTSEAAVLMVVVPASLLLSLPVAWLFNAGVERQFLSARPNGKQTAAE